MRANCAPLATHRRLLLEHFQAKIDLGNKLDNKNVFTVPYTVFHADFKYAKTFLMSEPLPCLFLKIMRFNFVFQGKISVLLKLFASSKKHVFFVF